MSTLAEDGEDGAEAPELSINDDELPPLDGLKGLEVRSDDQTIDGIFKNVMGSDAEKPAASAIMVTNDKYLSSTPVSGKLVQIGSVGW